ncbi:MAG: Rpn family recombination-promoting nuclease/putative transposase [Eubacteriales bacterium]|nr:Rpn family recombination-promoting nuclease/putative transposase [Eubacteriales bacterium]
MRDLGKVKKKVEQLNIIDDIFFQKMAEDIGFCEETISTAMGQKVKVLQVVPQDSIKNLQGRSVVVDALCELEDGRNVDVEIQKANDDDHQKRVRYNASCITANITSPGEKFGNVPDVVVIYISEFDMFHGGKAVYHVNRIVQETGKAVYNGMTEIYINTRIDDGSDIAKLMKIYTEKDAYDYERFPNTSARKAEFKKNEGGEQKMSSILRDIAKEWAEEMAQEIAEERAQEIAEEREEVIIRKLLKKGMPIEEVAEIAELLTEDAIKKIAEDI